MRLPPMILTGLMLCLHGIASAQAPEQIDQLEPGGGEWQAEYFGTFGPGGEREHALETMFGLTDRLAVGVEIEAEYSEGAIAIDTAGLKALYRLTGDAAPVALGLQVQLGFNDHARLAQAEARLIAEVQSDAWWAQANVMFRHSREDGENATGLAYAWSLQHSLGASAWLGLESSGQFAPLWRSAGAGAEAGHFAGPSLTFEWEMQGGNEIEFGLAYFRKIGGDGPPGSGRIFVQLGF